MSALRIRGFGTVEVHGVDYDPPLLEGHSAVVDGDTLRVGTQHWHLTDFETPPLAEHKRPGPHCADEARLGLQAKFMLTDLIAKAAARDALHAEILDTKPPAGDGHPVRLSIDGRNVGELLAEYGLARPRSARRVNRRFCGCP